MTKQVKRVHNGSHRCSVSHANTALAACERLHQGAVEVTKVGGLTRKGVTIVEVAKRAGVSTATVSRVLNNSDKCSPETRRRVYDAIAKLNYVPNHSAQSLKRQATQVIALAIPDIGNPVYVGMAKAVQETASRRGYRLLLISTEGSLSEEIYAVRSLAQRVVDGLIICSLTVRQQYLRELERAEAPVVAIGRVLDEAKVDNVRVDSEAGAVLAVQHLIDQGCRKIAFVNGTLGTVPANSRLAGYRRALFDNGLGFDPELVVDSDFTMMGGYCAMGALLDAGKDVDAVFAANDAMALGVLRRLRESRVRVPEDVVVVGMDDIDEGRISAPTLTTVSLLAGERGRIAAELLLDRITGAFRGEWRRVTVTPRLIIRESSVRYMVDTQEG